METMIAVNLIKKSISRFKEEPTLVNLSYARAYIIMAFCLQLITSDESTSYDREVDSLIKFMKY